MNSRAFSASMLALVAFTMGAASALAEPVTFFSYARHFQANSVNNFCFNTDFGAASGAVGSTCNSSGGAVQSNADARANIGNAVVAADAKISKTIASAASSHAEAIIGDSFRTATTAGSPFTWAGETARFALSVDGIVDPFNSGFANNSQLQLIILQAGALDTFATYQRTGQGFSDWRAAVLDEFTWGLGADYPFATTEGNLSTFPAQLTANFTPGADFDWAVWLITDVTASFGSVGSGNVDFFHTIEVAYEAPVGAVTFSASGAFPGTLAVADVPEPGSLALIGAAFGAFGLSRRRKDK